MFTKLKKKILSDKPLTIVIIIQLLAVIPKIVFDYSLFTHSMIELVITVSYIVWLFFQDNSK